MKQRFPLLTGLLLLSAANAQSLPSPNDPPAGAHRSQHPILPPATAKPVPRDFGRLPLSFESNRGQTNSKVRFLSHTADSTLFLTPSEAVFSMAAETSVPPQAQSALRKDLKTGRPSEKSLRVALRMQMVGANAKADTLT